ncbi:hypothetical protein ABEG18_03240 [Alsobacter sp. KACC 23698]|uniref:PDZ domain-containing protein n=1 Tax=Alsobacter sp. KACC 23698 TaxID=3149229 RepID=A0AAU7JHB8_9HYPH
MSEGYPAIGYSRTSPALNLETGARTLAIASLMAAALWGVAAARATQDGKALAATEDAPLSYAAWRPFGQARHAGRTGTEPGPDAAPGLVAPGLMAAGPAPLDAVRGLSFGAPPERPPAPDIEREFVGVSVVDGRTLKAGDLLIQLADVPAPSARETCLRLDGVAEPCATRAATRLELQVRWRKVECRYQPAVAGVASGVCKVGGVGLAQRLAASTRRAAGLELSQAAVQAAVAR